MLCEFGHAMGNAGGLEDYVAAFERYPGLQAASSGSSRTTGCCSGSPTARPAGPDGPELSGDGRAPAGHRFAYGGDFGEPRHDGAFVHDGILHSDPRAEAARARAPRARRAVRLTLDDAGRVVLVNAQPTATSLARRGVAGAPPRRHRRPRDGHPAVLAAGEETVVDVLAQVRDGASTLVLALTVGEAQP